MESQTDTITKNNLATMRLFFAFNVDSNSILASGKFLELNLGKTGIRFNRKANLHLTLLFCGEVEHSKLIDLISHVNSMLSDLNYTDPVFLEPCYSIRETRKGGMVWIEFKKNDLFAKLNRLLSERVRELCQNSSKISDPIPHITIARFKKGTKPMLPEMDAKFNKLSPLGFELWASCSGKNGLIYLPVFRFKSGKRAEFAG